MYGYNWGSISGTIKSLRCLVEKMTWTSSRVRVWAIMGRILTPSMALDDPFRVGLIADGCIPGAALRSAPGYFRPAFQAERQDDCQFGSRSAARSACHPSE